MAAGSRGLPEVQSMGGLTSAYVGRVFIAICGIRLQWPIAAPLYSSGGRTKRRDLFPARNTKRRIPK